MVSYNVVVQYYVDSVSTYIVINSIQRHNAGGIRLAVKWGDDKRVSGYKWVTNAFFATTMFTIINSALLISVSSKPFHF